MINRFFVMNNGYIKLHRKILDNPIISKPAYFTLWLAILLKANHKENKFMWNNEIIIVKEGQLITGRRELSKITGIKPTTIERILKTLENGHQIRQQTTTKFRLITVINWKEYQNNDNKTDNKRTTNGQQTDTNKNDKNDKNDKNILQTEVCGDNISKLLKEFEDINPTINYGNKTQRGACEYLIEKFGLEKTLNTIKFYKTVKNEPFCPVITTPYQLKEKIGQLIAYYNKSNNNSRTIIL